MEDQLQLLEAMLEDEKTQKGEFQTIEKWKGYTKRITHAIKTDGITKFRSNYSISKGYGDSPLFDPSIMWRSGSFKEKLAYHFVNNSFVKNKLIKPFYLHWIQAHYHERAFFQQYYYSTEYKEWLKRIMNSVGDFPDTLVGDCREFVDIDGIRISIKYIRTLMRIYNFSKLIDFTKIKSVFEIGGGFGANVHLLFHLYPNIKKCLYLDIPPVVYVATQYLKHFYPSQVIDYIATRNSNRISFKQNEEREIISICPWQIENVDANIELFWSGSTFQEIDTGTLNNYTKNMNKLLTPKCYICLICTVPESYDCILTSKFSNHFYLERIEPEIEKDISSEYYIGLRRAS